MIEVLHCVEKIREFCNDPDLQGTDLGGVKGDRRRNWHRRHRGAARQPHPPLQVDENDQVTYCNLIVSTTHNNEGMNRAVKDVAVSTFDGQADHRRHAEPCGGRDPRL
jgi:NAD-reducing hydrogenase large subunit